MALKNNSIFEIVLKLIKMSFNKRSSSAREHTSRSSPSRGSPRSDDSQWSRPEGRNSPNIESDEYGVRTRQIQDDSLDASSRALGKLIHASEVAQSNLAKLASQTEQMSKVDKKLDEADHHVKVSETKTTRLKALNGWFFLPAVGSKSAKRKQEALERKVQLQKENVMNGRDMESRHNTSRSTPNISSRGSSSVGGASHIHSTPDGLERSSVEKGIDSNLNQISAGLGRLKMMGASMNNELDKQKHQLSKIQDRADENKDKIGRLNRQMNNLSR